MWSAGEIWYLQEDISALNVMYIWKENIMKDAVSTELDKGEYEPNSQIWT